MPVRVLHIGSGQAHDVFRILRMPSGFLMSGLCLCGGLFLGVHAGREFAEGGKGRRKRMLVAPAMLIVGETALSLTV